MDRITRYTVLCFLFLTGCAGHPTIYPGKTDPGKTLYSYTFSGENLFPVYSIHRGLSPLCDANLHIGIPFWGSGFSLTYLATGTPGSTRMTKVNAGYIFQQNQAVDLTIVKEWHNPYSSLSSIMAGPRGTWILSDVANNRAFRVGFVSGLAFKRKMLFEVGYTHDFALGKDRRDPASQFPTGHHPITGLSVRIVAGSW